MSDNAKKKIKGPEKPWDPESEQAADEFVDFLRDVTQKKDLQDYLIDTYRKYHQEKIGRLKGRWENERAVNQKTNADHHTSGNLEPLMHETLNMGDIERVFGRGVKSTKDYLVRSAENRVEEIQRLLADIGGFSAQIKSCFARSTVVFLEQEDARHSFRERLIFSINLPNFELKRPWDHGRGKADKLADGRSSLQATWDDSVNALARIVESAGLKPKYCKNDRHYGRFVMKQDLRASSNLPDEYFSFTLDYNTDDKIKEMIGPYDKIIKDYAARLEKLERKLEGYTNEDKSPKAVDLRQKYIQLTLERDYFVATTPDPNQLDEGLLFLIEVSTLKDYHIVKDRMQTIMTRYILHLSQIAANDAEFDPEMEYQAWKAGKKLTHGHEKKAVKLTQEEAAQAVDGVPEYEVDSAALRPAAKKRAA